MMFLFTLSYSQHAKRELVETLLTFATILELRTIRSLNYMLFELSHDFESDRKKLMNVVKNRARSFHSCSEFSLPQLSHETWEDADERRRDKHQAAVKECLGIFADALIYQ